MAATIPVGAGLLLGLGAGWLIALIIFVLMLFMGWKTPAWTIFRAFLGRKAIVWVKDRAGMSDFRTAKILDHGVLEVDKLGLVLMEETSKTIDKKSKVPIFRVFSEYAVSLSDNYEAILKELREKGFAVNKFKDYEELIKLGSDDAYLSKYCKENFNSELERINFKNKIKQIKEIQLKPYKTYNINELGYMFPFNISPVYVDATITEEINRRTKKGLQQKKIMAGAFIIGVIILIGAAVAYKLATGGSQPQDVHVVIDLAKYGIQEATKNASLVI